MTGTSIIVGFLNAFVGGGALVACLEMFRSGAPKSTYGSMALLAAVNIAFAVSYALDIAEAVK